jgi:hypothetical protein
MNKRKIATPIPWCGFVKFLSGPTAKKPRIKTTRSMSAEKTWSCAWYLTA